MSGSIGVICNDSARYTVFWQALYGLDKPVNTVLDIAVGSDRSVGRNTLVRRSLERGSEWLLFLDDDHVFSPTLLKRLLASGQQVVASLYLQRVAPFAPHAYLRHGDGYAPISIPDIPDEEASGLVEVDSAGTGGMLVWSEIFRALDEPWFQHTTAKSEDHMFCDRVRDELGLSVHVDLGARLGHVAPGAVWPHHSAETGWNVGFTFSESATMMMPMPKPQEYIVEEPAVA